MRELSSSRMNFLEQGRAGFTYRTMIFILIAWCLLLGGIYGALVAREISAKRDIAQAKVELERITAEKDAEIKALEAIGRRNVGSGEKDDLTAILMSGPKWSRVLRQLTRNLTPQVWLQSIKVMSGQGTDPRLDIAGKSKSQRHVTNFMMNLESTGLFRRTELAQTKKSDDPAAEIEYDVITTPLLSKF